MKTLLDVKFDMFVKDFCLEDDPRDINWRRFVSYHFFSQFQPGRLDTDPDLLDQICAAPPDLPLIHGAFFLLNDQILSIPQDIDDILKKDQKGSLELFFLTFGRINDLIPQLEKLFCGLDTIPKQKKWISILTHAMSQKIMLRWKDQPALRIISYAEDDPETKYDLSDRFRSFFSDIDHIRIDRDRLLDIINSNENSYRSELDCRTSLLIPGGKEKFGNAYVICMPAQELIKLITTPDGSLRRNIFDDNVRDFQGNMAVNQEIMSTLKTHPDRFVLYNNGITIVCKKATTENGKYVLQDPQIVNGCQTCHMIYQAYRHNVNLDSVMMIAKIVGSNKEDITQGIVRGANRQNIVYEEAFETIRGFHKNLEKYFENNQINGYPKIYYERRSRQYKNNIEIKPHQKISFRGLIQSMVALFLNHVEDSHKHEYTLLTDYKDHLFIDGHSCQPYYLAAFLYLNIDILFRKKELPKELNNYKMHIMLLIKEMTFGPSPDLSSADIDQYCERSFAVLEGDRLKKYALKACEKFEDIRTKWIDTKGEQYRYGIKDSAVFRDFLIKEIYGIPDERAAEKQYTGYVMNIDLDKNNTLFGFIEHMPRNVFFHEFDNPDIDPSYIGKKVSYKIVRNGDQERAINVRLIKQ